MSFVGIQPRFRQVPPTGPLSKGDAFFVGERVLDQVARRLSR
jgi:hypothetical protein